MSEFETVYLSPREIKAAIKALEECGADNNYRKLLEVFHDTELLNAAKSARGELKKRQRSTNTRSPDHLREIERRQADDDRRRSALTNLRGEHADLLGSVQELLTSLLAVHKLLRDGQWLDARAAFDNMLEEVGWDESEIAAQLYALRNAANEEEATDLGKSET